MGERPFAPGRRERLSLMTAVAAPLNASAIRIFVGESGMLVASADVADGTFFALVKISQLG
jgi:hypothetical protein